MQLLVIFSEIMMKKIQGDLIQLALDGHFDVIVHGCNCFNTMGAGIAKSIKLAFPAVYAADRRTIKADRKKLGNYTKAEIVLPNGMQLEVINAYTQFHYSSSQPNVDYKAIRQVFRRIAMNYSHDVRIGIPMIGAGLAGGDWNLIERIIDDEMASHNLTLVEYRK